MFTPPVTVLDALGGRVVTSDGILYMLTACCRASVTGTERGVACRACYAPVAEHLGWAALVSDPGAAASLSRVLAIGAGIVSDPQGTLDRLAGEAVERARALAA
jgi:hypothetical protein